MAVMRVKVGHLQRRQLIGVAIWILSMLLGGAIGANVVGESRYQAEMAKLDLGPGSVGSPADGTTPKVSTLAELEANERFVLVNRETIQFGAWEGSAGGKLGDAYYTAVTLADGTVLAARVHYDAQSSEIIQDYQEQYDPRQEITETVTYPIGTLRPWPEGAESDAAEADWLTYRKGYLDMEGDQEKPRPNRSELCDSAAAQGIAIMMVLGLGLSLISEWLWTKKEYGDASPKNDLERWILGTYANWALYFGQFDHKGRMRELSALRTPIFFGGRPKDRDSRRMTRKVLKQDWDIKDRKELLDTVEYMSRGPGFQSCGEQSGQAWELCRSTQLLGMGYIAGWLTREEMISRSCIVGQVMQETFQSWDALCRSYLEGYVQWAQGAELPQVMIQNRLDIHNNLTQRPDSPYQLPWNLQLDPAAWERRTQLDKALEGKK